MYNYIFQLTITHYMAWQLQLLSHMFGFSLLVSAIRKSGLCHCQSVEIQFLTIWSLIICVKVFNNSVPALQKNTVRLYYKDEPV